MSLAEIFSYHPDQIQKKEKTIITWAYRSTLLKLQSQGFKASTQLRKDMIYGAVPNELETIGHPGQQFDSVHQMEIHKNTSDLEWELGAKNG